MIMERGGEWRDPNTEKAGGEDLRAVGGKRPKASWSFEERTKIFVFGRGGGKKRSRKREKEMGGYHQVPRGGGGLTSIH